MMESTAFFNAKAASAEVTLFLDIDPKKDTIKEFFFDGPEVQKYRTELEELKSLCLGKHLSDVRKIKRSDLTSETRADNGRKTVLALGPSLLHEAIASYMGEDHFLKEERDLLCLCFSVTKREITRKVLSNKDFELKTLIQDTMATSACGSCRTSIEKLIDQTRNENGMIAGMDHSRSRTDAKGQWVKVVGMYPGPLLIKLEELKIEWMKREGIFEQYKIEFVNIEGFHVDVRINSDKPKVVEGLLLAMEEYVKSRLGVLLFFHAV